MAIKKIKEHMLDSDVVTKLDGGHTHIINDINDFVVVTGSIAYFTATGAESGFTLAMSYTPATDLYQIYVNGLKLIETKHYTISGTALTFTSNFSLSEGDEVEEVVYYNVKGGD
jgi:hypothetical protein